MSLVLLGLAFLPAPAVTSQDPTELLVRSLVGQARSGLHVMGEIEQKEAGGGGFGGVMVLGGGGGGNAESFAGGFEAVAESGELWAVSHAGLPSFGVFRGNGRKFQEAAWEDAPPDLGELSGEFRGLLDFERVGKSAGRVEWKAAQDATTRTWTLRGELPVSLLPGPTGLVMGMEPRVLRIEARAVLEPTGAEARLQELEIRVVRSDPMAALQKRAMSGEFGSGEIEINLDDVEDLDQEEGTTTIYRFRPTTNAPTDRLQSFRKRCSQALAKQEF